MEQKIFMSFSRTLKGCAATQNRLDSHWQSGNQALDFFTSPINVQNERLSALGEVLFMREFRRLKNNPLE